MKFALNPNPYVRSKRSTFKIMMELLIGLVVVWLSSIIYYFVKSSPKDGFFAILNVVITVLSCSLFEIIYFIPSWKKEAGHNFKSLINKELNSFGYISGLILALLMPVGTMWWQLIITSFVTVFISKMLFGGFGYNIFNPAIVGRIFATICFSSSFSYGATVNAGSTILTNWSAASSGQFNPYIGTSGWNVVFGNYAGALGETFTLLIFIIGIVLALRKVIDLRITLSYLIMCSLTALIVGLMNMKTITYDPIKFMVLQVSTGGIMFGAVFCLTDPVTSPTSPLGKIVFGALAGFITMLIRFKGSSPEGVAYSILAVNMLTPLIDNIFKGTTNDKIKVKLIAVSALSLSLLLVSLSYSTKPSTISNEKVCITCVSDEKGGN